MREDARGMTLRKNTRPIPATGATLGYRRLVLIAVLRLRSWRIGHDCVSALATEQFRTAIAGDAIGDGIKTDVARELCGGDSHVGGRIVTLRRITTRRTCACCVLEVITD